MRQKLMFFLLLFPFALSAQDSLHHTISVKRNLKKIKTLTVYNYPKVNSKIKDAVRTEFSRYDEQGNIVLHSNFYNNTNETYDYDERGRLKAMKVFNIYLKTYMYQDTFVYNDKGLLAEKTRFMYNKL